MDLVKIVAHESIDALKDFVQGEASDLAYWAEEIAADAVRAVREGRQDVLKELANQAKVIAEIKRIRATGFAWDQIVSVVLSLAKVAVQAYMSKG